MSTAIAALSSSSIRYAEFVELILTVYAGDFIVGSTYTIFVVGTTNFTAIGASSNTVGTVFTATGVGTGTGKAQQIYTFCNAAAPVVVNGITFAGYGTFLGISEIQQDMKASSVDIKVSLTGLDINVVSLILGSPVKAALLRFGEDFSIPAIKLKPLAVYSSFSRDTRASSTMWPSMRILILKRDSAQSLVWFLVHRCVWCWIQGLLALRPIHRIGGFYIPTIPAWIECQ